MPWGFPYRLSWVPILESHPNALRILSLGWPSQRFSSSVSEGYATGQRAVACRLPLGEGNERRALDLEAHLRCAKMSHAASTRFQ